MKHHVSKGSHAGIVMSPSEDDGPIEYLHHYGGHSMESSASTKFTKDAFFDQAMISDIYRPNFESMISQNAANAGVTPEAYIHARMTGGVHDGVDYSQPYNFPDDMICSELVSLSLLAALYDANAKLQVDYPGIQGSALTVKLPPNMDCSQVTPQNLKELCIEAGFTEVRNPIVDALIAQ
jgi:hypothetical protein